NHPQATRLSESKWTLQVAYHADVNNLDASLRLSEKLAALNGKLKLWKKTMAEGKTATFTVLSSLLEDEAASFVDIQNITVEHLAKLIVECDLYISENVSKYSWVRIRSMSTWKICRKKGQASISQLIEIQNDETLHYDKKTK
ncbi:hypothetical protein LSAT2_014521, partial [Lamellibrachia satsuma]